MPLSNLCCISKQKKSARSHTVSCQSECPKHCRLRPHTRVVSPLSAFGSCQVSCVGSHPGLGRLMSEPKPEPTPEPAEPHKGTTQEPAPKSPEPSGTNGDGDTRTGTPLSHPGSHTGTSAGTGTGTSGTSRTSPELTPRAAPNLWAETLG